MAQRQEGFEAQQLRKTFPHDVPRTILVRLSREFDTPEAARAAWDRDKCGMASNRDYWDKLMGVEDLVLVLQCQGPYGPVDILTIDMRGQPRPKRADVMLDELLA